MNVHPIVHVITAVALASASGGTAAAGSPSQTGWAANGASACEKYLGPQVVGAILLQPAGHARRVDAQSCEYLSSGSGMIEIRLTAADVDVFRQELPRIMGAHPITGIGDAAYWNEAGALSAVKGHGRGCDISVLVGSKVRGEALAQQLGKICNALFALP